MKRLVNIVLFPLVLFSCKPGSSDQNAINEPESTESELGIQNIATQFPAAKLDELVAAISQEELETVINKGESEQWTRTTPDITRGEVTIKNKLAGDNLVKFVLIGRGAKKAIVGVQQQNAQVSTTEVWEYHYVANDEHPDQWNQYLLPEYKFDDFFDERVELPKEFSGKTAKSYLNYEVTSKSISVSLNKWLFMRELESNSMQPQGPLDPALVKYVYVLTWSGDSFEVNKVHEAGYNDIITFMTTGVDDPDGPGQHEFGCPRNVSVKASSVLPKEGIHNYEPGNILKISDAWSEGVSGDGKGEWIEFTLTKDHHIGDSWLIANGNTRNKEAWDANGRVKKMKVFVDDQVVCNVMLSNVATYQSFNIAPSWLKNAPVFRKGTRIRFVIEEVYKGSKFDDTLISYFVPTGNCG